MLPLAVTDLAAMRIGDKVALHWTMPRRTTDRVVLQADQQVEICRAAGAEPCAVFRVLLLAPGSQAQTTDQLPAALQVGTNRLMHYEVRLKNHAQHDAGPSNLAFVPAGWAPPAIQSVQLANKAQGIAVSWEAPAEDSQAMTAPGAVLRVRLLRHRLAAESATAPTKESTEAGVPQPTEQTLEAPEHPAAMAGGKWTPDSIVDADAQQNRSYSYTVQLVEQLTLEGHLLEMNGQPAETAALEARDTFAPAVPEDLAAVANATGKAIDLSWTAGPEPDLRGYRVYRRETDLAAQSAATSTPVLVSGPALVTVPSWSDTAAHPGVRYSYSVAAVDQSGNESARSAEVVEALPQ
ncbi:fibronectin type III domain-containing protein [Acidipila sp. EB88]|nr:fibronectin type III domain-containing protein [Acidipila sp. EB88]